jgi:hypothetical protein
VVHHATTPLQIIEDAFLTDDFAKLVFGSRQRRVRRLDERIIHTVGTFILSGPRRPAG